MGMLQLFGNSEKKLQTMSFKTLILPKLIKSVCRPHTDKLAHGAFFRAVITDTDDRNSPNVFYVLFLSGNRFADPDPDTETWNSGF